MTIASAANKDALIHRLAAELASTRECLANWVEIQDDEDERENDQAALDGSRAVLAEYEQFQKDGTIAPMPSHAVLVGGTQMVLVHSSLIDSLKGCFDELAERATVTFRGDTHIADVLEEARDALAEHAKFTAAAKPFKAVGDHAAEPWKVGRKIARFIEAANGDAVAECDGSVDSLPPARDDANARRIVACINHCAGISTELLERGQVATVVTTAKVA